MRAIFGVREKGAEIDVSTVEVANTSKRKSNAEKLVKDIQRQNLSKLIVAGKQYEVRFLFVG